MRLSKKKITKLLKNKKQSRKTRENTNAIGTIGTHTLKVNKRGVNLRYKSLKKGQAKQAQAKHMKTKYRKMQKQKGGAKTIKEIKDDMGNRSDADKITYINEKIEELKDSINEKSQDTIVFNYEKKKYDEEISLFELLLKEKENKGNMSNVDKERLKVLKDMNDADLDDITEDEINKKIDEIKKTSNSFEQEYTNRIEEIETEINNYNEVKNEIKKSNLREIPLEEEQMEQEEQNLVVPVDDRLATSRLYEDDLTLQIIDHEKTIEELNKKVSKQEGEIDKVLKETEDLSDIYKTEIIKNEQTVNELNKTIAKFEKEIQDLQDEIQMKENKPENEMLLFKLSLIEANLLQTQNRSEQLIAATDLIKQQNEEILGENTKLKEESSTLQEQLKALQTSSEEEKTKLEEELNEQLQMVETKILDITSNVVQLTTENTELTALNDLYEKKIAEREQSIQGLTDDLATKKITIAEATNKLEEITSEKEKIEKDLTERTLEIQKINEVLIESQALSHTYEVQIAANAEKIAGLTQAIEQLEKKSEEKEKEIQELEVNEILTDFKIEELKEELNELTTLNQEMIEINKKIIGDNATLTNDFAELNNQYKALATSSEVDKERLGKELLEKTRELELKKEELKNLTDTLKANQVTLEELNAEHESAKETYETFINVLATELKEKKITTEQAKIKLEEIKEEKNKIKAELDERNTQYKEVNAALVESQNIADSLKTDIEKNKKEITILRERVYLVDAQLERQKIAKIDDNKYYDFEIKKLENGKIELTKQLEQLTNANATLEEKKKEIIEENTTLKSNYENLKKEHEEIKNSSASEKERLEGELLERTRLILLHSQEVQTQTDALTNTSNALKKLEQESGLDREKYEKSIRDLSAQLDSNAIEKNLAITTLRDMAEKKAQLAEDMKKRTKQFEEQIENLQNDYLDAVDEIDASITKLNESKESEIEYKRIIEELKEKEKVYEQNILDLINATLYKPETIETGTGTNVGTHEIVTDSDDPLPGSVDTGSVDTDLQEPTVLPGSVDTGSVLPGSVLPGSGDTVPRDTGSGDTGSVLPGSEDTEPEKPKQGELGNNVTTTTQINQIEDGMSEIIIKIKFPSNAVTNTSTEQDSVESSLKELTVGGRRRKTQRNNKNKKYNKKTKYHKRFTNEL